jgi:hypothetical protein
MGDYFNDRPGVLIRPLANALLINALNQRPQRLRRSPVDVEQFSIRQ